jgi:mono/diheme cytochrome c family protein
MPSFVPMLDDEELTAVGEYVRFLSMRGEFEQKVVNELATDYAADVVRQRVSDGEKRSDIVGELESFLTEDLSDSLEFVADDLETFWTGADAEESVVVPTVARIEDSEESRRIGRELYLSKEINCLNCHGFYGKGDGPQSTDFEKNPATGEPFGEPGLHDVWGNINQPRNLTEGIYRGGRRPVDLFRRIQAGIKGTAMPSFSKNLTHEQTWHIVNYVLSIPFEPEPGNGKAATTAASL